MKILTAAEILGGLIILVCVTAGAYFIVKRLRIIFWRIDSIARHADAIDQSMVKSTQLEGLAYLYRLLDWPSGTLPPTRGWAASPDFLIILAEWLFEHKPAVIVELGSGVTTMVIARVLELNGHGTLYSVDHDGNFGSITQARLRRNNLKSHHIHAPLVKAGDLPSALPWYDFKGVDRPIDLLVIDGPPARLGAEIRGGAVRLFNQLSDRAAVLMDDADRPGERAVAQQWAVRWPNLNQIYIDTEKGTLLMTKNS